MAEWQTEAGQIESRLQDKQVGDKVDITNLEKSLSPEDYKEAVKKIVTDMKAAGKGVQINASGDGKTYLEVFK